MALYAPFGTDEQPSINVKIVAGKPREVKGNINAVKYESLSKTPYKYSSRPPWFLDNFSAENRMSNKPYLTSISSLSMNSSHEEAVWKKHQNAMGKPADGEKPVNNSVPQVAPASETEAVDFMLSRLLSKYPASKFKEIYTEMAGYDPRLTSCITAHQVELTLKRNKVPIPSNILGELFDKFSVEDNTNIINYENLIKYLFSYSLKGSSLEAVRQRCKMSTEPKLDHTKVDSGANPLINPQPIQDDTSSPRSEHSSYVSPRSLVKKAMDDREEAYLLVQIEQAFKANGTSILSTLKKLHHDLQKLGNGTEYIKADQIERTCSWLHLPLHHSLMEKVLDRFEVKKNGKINWIEFIGFLEKGVPLSVQQYSSLDKVKARSSLPFWESQTPLAPLLTRKHVDHESSSTTEKNTHHDNEMKSNHERKWQKEMPDNDHNLQHDFRRSCDVLKVDRDSNVASTNTMHVMAVNPNDDVKPDSTNSEKTAESLDEKLERFSHLTAALLRSDVDKNGTLKARDVLRIVNNYNLIYNLHLPEEKVLEIAQHCTVPSTHDVVIDELVKTLWGLMKTV